MNSGNMVKTGVLNDPKKDGLARYIIIAFNYLLPAIAVFYILLYIFVAISRMSYPYELEWMEGRSLEHVHRLLAGQSIFPAPSVNFIPLTYTPLYFYVSSISALFFGDNFFSLRLVSFAASLGIITLIYIYVKRETNSGYFAVLAAGLFAATFRLNGFWFDIARVDSLFLLFLLWGIYFVRFGKSSRSIVIAAVFFSLSFFTKQTAFILISPLVIYLLFTNWKHCVLYIISMIILILGISYTLEIIYNYWYNLYTFVVPYSLSKYLALFKLKQFIRTCLLLPLPFALIATCYYFISKLKAKEIKIFFFYFCIFVGLFGGSLPSFFNVGGYYNDLMPVHLAITLLFAVGLVALMNIIHNMRGEKSFILSLIVYILCIFQFYLLAYDPFKFIPCKEDASAGDELVAKIASIKGDVLIPSHPYLAVRAGKSYYIHISALYGYIVLMGKQPGGQQDTGVYSTFREHYACENPNSNMDLYGQLTQDIKDRKFGAIILDNDKFPIDLEPYYKLAGKLFDQDVFWTYIGVHTRPNLIYLPTQIECMN
jgi:hypothetical protein